MSGFDAIPFAIAAKVARDRHARIERACEEALQGGEHGVLVQHTADGAEIIEVSPDVPYGEIHYRPRLPGGGSIMWRLGHKGES